MAWKPEVEEAIQKSRSSVICIGPGGVASYQGEDIQKASGAASGTRRTAESE